MMYDAAVMICRIQPPHMSHILMAERGLSIAKKLIVVIGSADEPRTTYNPFTAFERKEMFLECLPEYRDRISCVQLINTLYSNSEWVSNVLNIVQNNLIDKEDNVALLGYEKDMATKEYLDMFPQWKKEFVNNINDLNATDVRNFYFDPNNTKISNTTFTTPLEEKYKNKLPSPVLDFLLRFSLTPSYIQICKERKFLIKVGKSWENAPYKPIFVTVDNVVIQSGHVLLVQRRSEPGKGLMALPGGYVNEQENIHDSALRELFEETKIKVSRDKLLANFVASEIFSHPKRSLRGRIITHVYAYELPPGELPKVKGSDDAKKAVWTPLNVFKGMRSQMFEDHYDIITTMVGKLKNE